MRINKRKLIIEMAKNDLNQKQLAKKAGISRSTVSYICSGKSCSDDVGIKISNALNVRIEEIIDKG